MKSQERSPYGSGMESSNLGKISPEPLHNKAEKTVRKPYTTYPLTRDPSSISISSNWEGGEAVQEETLVMITGQSYRFTD